MCAIVSIVKASGYGGPEARQEKMGVIECESFQC
jgi:hypothetical protein